MAKFKMTYGKRVYASYCIYFANGISAYCESKSSNGSSRLARVYLKLLIKDIINITNQPILLR